MAFPRDPRTWRRHRAGLPRVGAVAHRRAGPPTRRSAGALRRSSSTRGAIAATEPWRCADPADTAAAAPRPGGPRHVCGAASPRKPSQGARPSAGVSSGGAALRRHCALAPAGSSQPGLLRWRWQHVGHRGHVGRGASIGAPACLPVYPRPPRDGWRAWEDPAFSWSHSRRSLCGPSPTSTAGFAAEVFAGPPSEQRDNGGRRLPGCRRRAPVWRCSKLG